MCEFYHIYGVLYYAKCDGVKIVDIDRFEVDEYIEYALKSYIHSLYDGTSTKHETLIDHFRLLGYIK